MKAGSIDSPRRDLELCVNRADLIPSLRALYKYR